MVAINLPDTLVYSSKKTGKSYDLPLAKWTEEVAVAVLTAGVNRYFTDVHASAKGSDDKGKAEADALILKKIDSLNKGDVRAARDVVVDPVQAEARKLAVGQVQKDPDFKAWLVANKLVATKGEGLKALIQLAKDAMQDPAIQAQAKANVESTGKLSIKLDLSKLSLSK